MAIISQEELNKIKQIQGKIIGFSFREDFEFIKNKKGEEGLRKIERALQDLGYFFKPDDIKKYQWYPWYQNILILVLAKNIFHWNEKVFWEWGRFNAKISFIAKLMMKFFVSFERLLKEAGNYWQRYFTLGKLEVETLNQRERFTILILKEFPSHPLFCRELEGFFWQTASYVLPKEGLKVEEIECPFQGGKVHRFKISW